MRRRRRARLFVKRAQDDRVRVGQVRKRPQARLGALRNKLRDEVRGVDGLTVRLQGGESESGRDQGRAEIDPRSGARAGHAGRDAEDEDGLGLGLLGGVIALRP